MSVTNKSLKNIAKVAKYRGLSLSGVDHEVIQLLSGVGGGRVRQDRNGIYNYWFTIPQ